MSYVIPDILTRKPVGVVAPSSAPKDAQRIEKGLAYLQQLGLAVETRRSDFSPHGYLAGTDEVRAEELNFFFRRNDVDVLLCLRGGYGGLRILDHLDYDSVKTNPKLLVGYSDVTAIQLALKAICGQVSISGPMVAVEFATEHPNQRSFWELVASHPEFRLTSPTGSTLSSIRQGSCEGELIGGNLSVLCKLLGTPFLPDLDGAILFIEDVGEPPYRLDGMFAQLKLAGILDRLAGVVLGAFTEAEPVPGKPSFTVDQVVDTYFRDLGVPVAAGLCYGHFPVKNAIPIGVRARLEVNDVSADLTLLESVWKSLSTPDTSNRTT